MRVRHEAVLLVALAVAGGAACLWDDDAAGPPANPPPNPTGRTLEISRSGGDSGSTITVTPPDVTGSDVVNATYSDGTSVTVTVAPGAGFVFVRIDWDDGSSTTTNPSTVVMDRNRTGVAVIAPE